MSKPVIKEKKGVAAIIALQALAGIVESEAKAKKGWASMSASERETTMAAHAVLCGGKTSP